MKRVHDNADSVVGLPPRLGPGRLADALEKRAGELTALARELREAAGDE